MEPSLKEALLEKLRLALDEFRRGELKVSLEKQERKTSLSRDEKRPYKLLFLAVEKKLLKTRQWREIQAAMAFESFQRIAKQFERDENASRDAELSAARERQMELFPGFENLPVRVKKGSKFANLSDLTVGEFQAYVGRYFIRVARSRRVGDELMRLAEITRPIAQTDPSMLLVHAYALQSHKLTVVPPAQTGR